MKMPQEITDLQNRIAGFNDCYCMVWQMLNQASEDHAWPEDIRSFLGGFTDGMARDQELLVRNYLNQLRVSKSHPPVRFEYNGREQ